jgi:hypothetical protein
VTRVVLAVLGIAGLVGVGVLWGAYLRSQQDATRIAAHQRSVEAVADSLAEVRADRVILTRTMDSLAALTKRKEAAADSMATEGWRREARLTAYRDSLRQVGATTVPLAEYDTVIALAEYRGAQLEAQRDVSAMLREQLRTAANLRASDTTETALWRGRAERAEALLRAVPPPGASKNRGWGVGPTLAMGGVTVAACAERVLSAGCLAGAAVLASRL